MNHVNDNAIFYWRNHSPHDLQLAEANIIGLIIIPSGPKFDVLWFFSVPEAYFRGFIKTSNDMSKILDEYVPQMVKEGVESPIKHF
jgi:hypothetical protein